MTKTITAPELEKMMQSDDCILIDIREPDEYARENIPGARNVPLSRLASEICPDGNCKIVFHCRSGMRTNNAAEQLAGWANGETYLLQGGIEAWRAGGHGTAANTKAPMELQRQVQITAGSLIFLGALLSIYVAPLWSLLPAAMGLGLFFTGVTNNCAMSKVLLLMPWNAPLRAA